MAKEYNRDNMIEAIKEHARGHIAKHAMNVEVYLKNSAGVGEHQIFWKQSKKNSKLLQNIMINWKFLTSISNIMLDKNLNISYNKT